MSFKEKIADFKVNLARALDDNLHTRQWHNLVDYLIIFMILLSTVEIFLSTFDVHPTLRKVLIWVDIVTLVFFTVEVALRIWVAPLIDSRFNGWKGRLRYCFTFYGFIDVVSTFPFYLQWLIPLPFGMFKVLRTARVVRLFRVSRYMKSFKLLSDALAEKRRELMISMQFLIIITLILSLVLFFFEHEAQPDVYHNGFVSVIWAFAQYIGDPGQFADTPPLTVPGRVIACIVGLLGIAIVAVPAGIIGAGFTEAMERETKKDEIKNNASLLRGAFQRKLDRPSGIQVVPPFQSVATLQAKLAMKHDEIVDAVNSPHAPFFRLVNPATTIPVTERAIDSIAVEHFVKNRPYGCFIDRGSKITICSPSSYADVGIGNWSYYLALIGGFNYISRESGDRAVNKSFFQHDDPSTVDGLPEFLVDMHSLLDRPEAWCICVLVSSGALEPEYPTNIHLQIGGPKGDGRRGGEGLFVRDEEAYSRFYDDLSDTLRQEYNLSTDHQAYHDTSGARQLFRRNDFANGNNIIMRLEWHKILWDPRRILIARTIASVISRDLAGCGLPDNPVLKQKHIGFDGY